jgi:hypothetical protein
MLQSRGSHLTITLCPTCDRQFCSRHKVLWHSEHTCAEWDIFLGDPSFRSKAQVRAAIEKAQAQQDKQLRQQILDAENRFAQSLMNDEQASQARLRARAERLARERQLAEEEAAREEQWRREWEGAMKLRDRKRQEETLTDGVFSKLTKPCPSCRAPIEKNGGW